MIHQTVIKACRKIGAYPNLLIFLFNIHSGACPHRIVNFSTTPFSCSLCSSISISSFEEKGTFLFGLKTGFTFCFSSKFTLVLVHTPNPSEKTLGNSLFKTVRKSSFCLEFFFSDTLTRLQNEFMGSSHKSNKTIQSIPKRQEFIPGTTDTFEEKVFDPRDTQQLNSPLNFNLFPDTPLAILDVFFQCWTTNPLSSHFVDNQNIATCIQK